MSKKFNKDTLVSVKVNDFYPSPWYVYKPELRFLGIRFRKGGVYGSVMGHYMCQPEELIAHKFIDGKVCDYPEVILTFVNGDTKVMEFMTLELAKEEAKKYMNEGEWI